MGAGCSVCADYTGGQLARLVWAYGALNGSEELVGDCFFFKPHTFSSLNGSEELVGDCFFFNHTRFLHLMAVKSS